MREWLRTIATVRGGVPTPTPTPAAAKGILEAGVAGARVLDAGLAGRLLHARAERGIRVVGRIFCCSGAKDAGWRVTSPPDVWERVA